VEPNSICPSCNTPCETPPAIGLPLHPEQQPCEKELFGKTNQRKQIISKRILQKFND
jgi:hypothetical protein